VEKWAAVANGVNFLHESVVENRVPWNGLIVPTLGSGKLYLTLDWGAGA
jgi:hypothetical protein